MTRILAMVAVLLFVTPAWGQVTHTIHGDPLSFPETVPPANLKWEIATDVNQRVAGVLVNGIPAGTGDARQFNFSQQEAIRYGINWNAFVAAANDPAYTRSIVTFGGVEKESPLLRSFTPGSFKPDTISAIIDGWRYPAFQHGTTLLPFINAGAAMRPAVPEPATWAMVAIGLVTLLSRQRD